MGRITIEESGLVFGEFEENNVWHFEKTIVDAFRENGIKKVEFILKYTEIPSIIFVEAKSSIPKQNDEFFEDVKNKMNHSLILWFTSVCGRHEEIYRIDTGGFKRS